MLYYLSRFVFLAGLAVLLYTQFLMDDVAGIKLPASTFTAINNAEEMQEREVIEPPYLVNLFASWCSPCLSELPQLRKLQSETGITIIGIAQKDTPTDTKHWVKQHDAPFDRVYFDESGTNFAGLKVRGLPMTYVVDRASNIQFVHRGAILPRDMEKLSVAIRNVLNASNLQ